MNNFFKSSKGVLGFLYLVCGASFAQSPSSPEAPSGYHEKKAVYADRFMVAAAHPLASKAGYDILKKGGSAVDAAIAIQMVLTLVEPQSSGLGGGAFLMFYDAIQQTIQAYDGRETAPIDATESLFLDTSGKPYSFYGAVVGGRSVGTPGVLRMLELAHHQHGRLPWSALFHPAIQLAEQGFKVTPRLHSLLKSDKYLHKDPVAAQYFYDEQNQARPVGYLLKNPDLAKSLRAIAQEGTSPFYRGPIGWDIVTKVRAHRENPGLLKEEDLIAYKPLVRQPICSSYHHWEICGFPPPSSGGIAVIQMLKLLENKDLSSAKPQGGMPSPLGIHWVSEAGRLVFADRNQYIADPDFVPIPNGLWDNQYLSERSTLIGEKSMGQAQYGSPPGQKVSWNNGAQSYEQPSTSQISIVDRFGNAVSMTTTIEDQFGSRQMVRGFLLNNQLTDFSFPVTEQGQRIANSVAAGKRPRSSMAPTLVFKKAQDGKGRELFMIIGSPGGSSIINYVAKTLFATLNWKMDIQESISLANFGSRNGPTEIEKDRIGKDVLDRLKERGHEIKEVDMASGLHAIKRIHHGKKSRWEGGADPRREGVVLGD